MKKEYVKPEMAVELFMAELAFLGGSDETVVDPDKPVAPFSNDREEGRSWGNLWD